MLAVSFCLNLSGSSLLVHKARISPEAFPGGPSYSRRSLLHNSFAAKAKALVIAPGPLFPPPAKGSVSLLPASVCSFLSQLCFCTLRFVAGPRSSPCSAQCLGCIGWKGSFFFACPSFCMSCCASKQTHLRRPPLECQPATQWKSVFTGDGIVDIS